MKTKIEEAAKIKYQIEPYTCNSNTEKFKQVEAFTAGAEFVLSELDAANAKIEVLEKKLAESEKVLLRIQNSVAVASWNENPIFKRWTEEVTIVIRDARQPHLTRQEKQNE